MTILAIGSVPTETKTGSLTSTDLCAIVSRASMTFRSIKVRGNFIGCLVRVLMATLASPISECDLKQELLSANRIEQFVPAHLVAPQLRFALQKAQTTSWGIPLV